MLDKLIRFNPFRGPEAPVRRATYGTIFAVFVLYVAVYFYTQRSGALSVRSFCYTAIGFLYLVSGNNIQASTQYHPAYKWEKRLGGVGFIGLGASTGVGLVGNTVFLWVWVVLMLVAQVSSLEFVLYRNRSKAHQYLRTIGGPMSYPSSVEEADQIVDRANAIIRHRLCSREMRASVREALDFPTSDEVELNLRAQIRERRQRAMEDAAMAVDVEADSWG